MQTITKTRVRGKVVTAAVALTVIIGVGYAAFNLLPAAGLFTTGKSSFSVSLSPQVQPAQVLAGTKAQTFAGIVFSNTLNQDVIVRELNFTVTTSKTSPAQVSNFRLYDNGTQLSTTNDSDSGTATKVTDGQSAVVTFTLTTPLRLTSKQSKTLLVKADVSLPAALGGVYKVGIASGSPQPVLAYYNNGKPVRPVYTFNAGVAMAFISSGNLSIASDSSSPSAGLMPANTSGITLAVFNARAYNEAINIEKIYVTGEQANNGGWDQIQKLYLYNGSTLINTTTPTSTDGSEKTVLVDLTNNPLRVPKDGIVKLTFKADTANSNAQLGSTGASGQGIKLKINSGTDVTAKGASSGTSVTVSLANAVGNAQYLFRSVPIVTQSPNSGWLASGTMIGQVLYNFTVVAYGANNSSELGLYNATFKIVSTGGVTVQNLAIHQGSTLLASKATSDPNGDNFVFSEISTIDKWISKTYELRADVSCTVSSGCVADGSNASLTVYMLGDSQFPTPLPTSIVGLGINNHFAWTDFWQNPIVGAAGSDVTTLLQWSNGYLVPMANGSTMLVQSQPSSFSR